ncbi:MAG TPA: lipopolysaccharide heptosyltransferase II [Burkholderiales bacterium]|nr:lipopolysaccharide heptosyltransferase II [Burkholderiales bacterium]
MRILVVAPSWIGDTVLAQPLFKLLHARHDALALDVLAPSWTLPLVERMPEVRRATGSPAGHGELRLELQRQTARELAREGYDQAIVLPNSFKSALAPWLARVPVRTGYLGELRWGLLNDARRVARTRHPQISQQYAALSLARGETLPDLLPAPALRVDEAQRHATLARLGLDADRPAAALCPGAEYGPAKRWPARHFADLAQRLAGLGFAVWLVGSANDAATGSEIARLAPGAVRDLCGRTTLAEALDVLDSARIVVSNDSGLMHVAAALQKPLVALYGSSSPAYTPPLSRDARILKLDLPCSPCFKRECPLGHFKCMVELTADRVLSAIDSTGALAAAIPVLEKNPERH